jgi:hypothetical protein
MTKAEKALEALEAIRKSNAVIITPSDAAVVLSCDPQSIRMQAAEDPSKLGFPVCRTGQTTMIPRIPFLRWVTGEGVS